MGLRHRLRTALGSTCYALRQGSLAQGGSIRPSWDREFQQMPLQAGRAKDPATVPKKRQGQELNGPGVPLGIWRSVEARGKFRIAVRLPQEEFDNWRPHSFSDSDAVWWRSR